MRRSPILLIAPLVLAAAGLSACASDDDASADGTVTVEQQIAALDDRVASLERDMRGQKWLTRQVISADPAGVVAELQADVDELQAELDIAEDQAEQASAATAEQSAEAQSALEAAQQAVDEARDNVEARVEDRDALISEAGARLADARDAVDAWLAGLTESADDTLASPAATGSPAAE